MRSCMFEQPSSILDPKADLVFKKVFSKSDTLISFLNNVLPLPSNIVSLTYLSPEQIPDILPDMKFTTVDVKCKDDQDRTFIVEMQMSNHTYFKDKVLFGATRAYSQQLDRGKWYSELAPVYALGILNDVAFKESKEWFHHYLMTDTKDISKTLKGVELIFIELPKFKPETILEKKMTVLWLRFLKLSQGAKIPKDLLEDQHIHKAIECLQISSFTKEELARYEWYWDSISMGKSIVGDATEKGMEKGRAEGGKVGMKKGEEVGKVKGRVEAFFEMGVSEIEIAQKTGLSLEEVRKILGVSPA